MNKETGILMPVASLPNRFGSGDFGPDAYRFADDVAKAGFSIWQILPLNPLGYGSSPYQPFSSYAMDEIYISLDLLADEGLIKRCGNFNKKASAIDYEAVRAFRTGLLREAFHNYKEDDEAAAFEAERPWLESYAIFRAFKEKFEQKPWTSWPKEFRDYPLYNADEQSWKDWPEEYRDYPVNEKPDLSLFEEEIRYQKFLQLYAFKQWKHLKEYANRKGVKIMGDIPFYVGHDSEDCWAGRPNFLLTKDGDPRFIAGVPPDYFSATGQRWGNPIYDWDYMEEDGFTFWLNRIAYNSRMFDIIRLDHFRAFDTYWKVPASCPTAIEGEWLEAPGEAFFNTLLKELPDISLIAEDLGDLRPEVYELRDKYDFAGMHILEFEFSPEGENTQGEHSLTYTGTHDNEPIRSWIGSMTPRDRRRMRKWLRANGYEDRDICRSFLCYTLNSDSEIVIIPISDWLHKGVEGRLNQPGTVGSPNWEWRMKSFREFEHKIPMIRRMIRKSGRRKKN